MDAALIAVDWGTTSFRAYLADGAGAVLDAVASADGILAVAEGRFAATLWSAVGRWLDRRPGLPVIMSGMIGSRQGWVEAPYVACPAGLAEIAARLVPVPHARIAALHLVPGVVHRGAGDMPDVMRGEETQVLGALSHGGADPRLFLLPGTHAKWVRTTGGRIAAFESYMTGEVYGALCNHTILGRLIPADAPADEQAFARGVGEGAAAGPPGALLNRIFAARTRVLVDAMPPGAVADYLSGLLIGAELASGTASHRQGFTIIGTSELTARYRKAAEALGVPCAVAGPAAAAAGAVRIARAARLIGDPR